MRKKLLIILLCPLLLLSSLYLYAYLRGSDLSTSDKNISTHYEIRISDQRIIYIKDPYNKIVRSMNQKTESIHIDNGVRTILFTAPVILSTKKESASIDERHVQLKGYMGIFSKDKNFHVTQDGSIDSAYWHGG